VAFRPPITRSLAFSALGLQFPIYVKSKRNAKGKFFSSGVSSFPAGQPHSNITSQKDKRNKADNLWIPFAFRKTQVGIEGVSFHFLMEPFP
jgi:hypothetical protein